MNATTPQPVTADQRRREQAARIIRQTCCRKDNGLDLSESASLEIADAVLALSALERQDWQPIETAPKDGREVLLAVKVRAGIPNCLLVGHYMRGGHCIDDHPPIDAGWYFWNGCMFDRAAVPTHWRPLGAPPQVAAQREVKS